MADETDKREENRKARERVKWSGETMMARCNTTTLDTFNEKEAGRGYRRWRRQIEAMATSAGADFLAALHAVCPIEVADVYTEAHMLLDDPRGIPYMTMPQIRQESLIAMMRGSLSVGGESLRLIEMCRHAG